MTNRYPIRKSNMTRFQAKMIQARINWNNETFWMKMGDKAANHGIWFGIILFIVLVIIGLLIR